MAIQHPNDAFRFAASTRAFNNIPNNYGRIRQSTLFTPTPVNSNVVGVMEVNGVLNLLPAKQRGAEPTLNTKASRSMHYFEVPHYPLQDRIEAQSVQNTIDWMTGESVDTMADSIARAMNEHVTKHAITEEWLMTQALTGIIKNADASTIYNLFTKFSITKKTIDFPFSVATTDVRGLVMDVLDHIETNLMGETMTGVEVMCSPEWFKAFVDHELVRPDFERSSQQRVGDVRPGFEFAGVTFRPYLGQATDKDGTTRKFVAADIAQAFPIGTQNTFEIYYAPPVLNGIAGANSLGAPLYAMETEDPKGRFVELDTEMDALPICKRPALLVELTKS